jgi:hypothetical protein
MKLTPEQRAELKTRLRTPEPKKKKVETVKSLDERLAEFKEQCAYSSRGNIDRFLKKVAKHQKSFQQCRLESSLNWNGKLIRI